MKQLRVTLEGHNIHLGPSRSPEQDARVLNTARRHSYRFRNQLRRLRSKRNRLHPNTVAHKHLTRVIDQAMPAIQRWAHKQRRNGWKNIPTPRIEDLTERY